MQGIHLTTDKYLILYIWFQKYLNIYLLILFLFLSYIKDIAKIIGITILFIKSQILPLQNFL